jgi:hypothetical protein
VVVYMNLIDYYADQLGIPASGPWYVTCPRVGPYDWEGSATLMPENWQVIDVIIERLPGATNATIEIAIDLLQFGQYDSGQQQLNPEAMWPTISLWEPKTFPLGQVGPGSAQEL